MSSRVEVLLWAHRVLGRKGGAPHELLEIPADATLAQAQDAFHKVARIAHPDLHRTTLDADELEKVTSAYSHVAAAYQAMRGGMLKVPDLRPVPPPVDTPRVRRPSDAARSIILPGGGIVSARGHTPTRPPASRTTTATTPPVAATAAAAATPMGPGRSSTPTAPPPLGRPSSPTAPPPMGRASHPTAPPPLATPRTRTAAMPPATVAPAPPAAEGSDVVNPATAMNAKALVAYRKAQMSLRQGDLRTAVLHLKLAVGADPASTFLRQALAEVEAALRAP